MVQVYLMESARMVDSGDMLAVWLRDEERVTLKKIYKEPGQVRLQPANREMEPIYVDPHDVWCRAT